MVLLPPMRHFRRWRFRSTQHGRWCRSSTTSFRQFWYMAIAPVKELTLTVGQQTTSVIRSAFASLHSSAPEQKWVRAFVQSCVRHAAGLQPPLPLAAFLHLPSSPIPCQSPAIKGRGACHPPEAPPQAKVHGAEHHCLDKCSSPLVPSRHQPGMSNGRHSWTPEGAGCIGRPSAVP